MTTPKDTEASTEPEKSLEQQMIDAYRNKPDHDPETLAELIRIAEGSQTETQTPGEQGTNPNASTELHEIVSVWDGSKPFDQNPTVYDATPVALEREVREIDRLCTQIVGGITLFVTKGDEEAGKAANEYIQEIKDLLTHTIEEAVVAGKLEEVNRFIEISKQQPPATEIRMDYLRILYGSRIEELEALQETKKEKPDVPQI